MKIQITLDIEEGIEADRLPYNVAMRLRGESRLGALAVHNCLKKMHQGTNGIPKYTHNHSVRLLLEDIGAILEGKEAKTFEIKAFDG